MENSSTIEKSWKLWIARVLIGWVFFANLTAAIPYILTPEPFVASFELSGIPGKVMVRSIGTLFLMWNVTYPPILLRPHRYRVLFQVVIAQQIIGLASETWMWFSLPTEYAALRATGSRYILFDGIGLIALLIAFLLTRSPRVSNQPK